MPVRTTEIVADGFAYPECPRWRADGLWFSDQHAEQIVRIGPDGVPETMAHVPGGPAGIGWLPDGTLLAVSMHDRALLQIGFRADDGEPVQRSAELTIVADLAPCHPGLSNEMVVDARGRCYVGNIGFDFYGGEEPRPTVLVVVEPGSEPRVVAEDLLVPNGTVITARGDRLIIAESFAHRLTSFRVGPRGNLDDRRVFADLGDEIPDGICMDAGQGVWYGSIGRHEVVRVEEGGRVTDRVSTGDREAIACMLGGDDRRDLFVCTSRTLDPLESVTALSGAIEVVRVDLPGEGRP